ncbi:MaoC family dehydratase [Nocardia higoensis]|uniref:MaoC family dehydratase n=1 Tax=Nocardia higoensis TaxID=228599 RepID=UPI0002D32C6F|nr:MaoC family dehydratase [Nocardia higoensis]
MRVFDGIADLEKAVGEHLGYSDWYTVTQEKVNLFAEATGDHQWIHVDPERAAQGPFGGPIAHGFLTLSLLPVLSKQVFRVDGLKMGINYGQDKVRFPSSVLVGSRLRAGIELLSVERSAAGARVRTRVTVQVEEAPKPACVAEHISVMVD